MPPDDELLETIFAAADLSEAITVRLRSFGFTTYRQLLDWLGKPRNVGDGTARFNELGDLFASENRVRDILDALAAFQERNQPMRKQAAVGDPTEWREAHEGVNGKGRPSLAEAMRPGNGKHGPQEGQDRGIIPLRDALREVLLDHIQPSPRNPRKHFDEGKLEELAASIKAQGLLQPLLVRPLRKSTKIGRFPGTEVSGYELVCGERRYRAAKLAGLEHVPCVVSELSDLQAAEARLLENLQRDDLQPLDEARGLQEMLDEHGYTVEALAAKIGKSEAYVYAARKLLDLPARAAKLVEAGELSPATAGLIARLPSAPLRERALKELLEYKRADQVTFREAKEQLQRRFTIELKQAPFDRDDATLVPRVGACTTCPKMAGNNRAAFPEGRADLCTDPDCYAAKEKAAQERVLDEAEAQGQTVLRGKHAAGLFQYGNLRSDEYLDLSDHCYQDAKHRTYGALLKGHLAPGDIVLAFEPATRHQRAVLHKLVPRAKGQALLRKLKLVVRRPAGGSSVHAWQKKQREEQAIRREVAVRLAAEAAAAGERLSHSVVGWSLPMENLLRAWIGCLCFDFDHDDVKLVLERRGLVTEDMKANRLAQPEEDRLLEETDKLRSTALVGLLAELLVVQTFQHSYRSSEEAAQQLCAALGLDAERVERQVKQERKAKKAKPGKKKEVAAP
jgi:ParB/RepB/Spo0J family partition protein